MKFDAKRNAEIQQETSTAVAAQSEGNLGPRNLPSHTKEPTQIIIYGYATSRAYAAIDLYEKTSGGMICEDYDREAPTELHRYQTTFGTERSVHSRPLTKREKALAFKYDGGQHWLKLTCDSAEAAARAMEYSPVQVQGHWVYAELWSGKAPDSDQPIPITEEDRQKDSFTMTKFPRKPSQTLSSAFSQAATSQKRATSTLPRSFKATPSQIGNEPSPEAGSPSPSTASSATAVSPEYPNLRNRHPSQAEQNAIVPAADEIAPGIQRYKLRPASEAFLPQPTWWERQMQWLGARGLIPTDFIGEKLPLMDDGSFNWAKASWYWCTLYWIDCHLGTDICGLKGE